MMKETPIAFGLTLVVCLALFFYCWYIRKLRNRLASVHVSATPDEVHEKTGLEKDVIDSFPTVKTYELKVNIKDELQCPICLIEYGDAETLRKLPHCGHVFHIHCVDPWLANQVTCPVCRIELTGTAKLHQSAYCQRPSTPNSVTIEVDPATPTWILVNRPFPLPQDPRGIELLNPILGLQNEIEHPGWGAIYLQKVSSPTAGFSFRSPSADIAIIESKDCISHSSISERWMTESFSFGISSGGDVEEARDVAEMYRSSPTHGHLPLTASPEHCIFEFLPIVTGQGGDSSSGKAR